MITLRIFLIGLIALVPDFEQGTLKAVLQDARSFHHMHYPVLIYECANYSGTCYGVVEDDELFEKEIVGTTQRFNVEILNNYRIEIEGARRGSLEFVTGRHRPSVGARLRGDVPGNREEAEDLFWIPAMANVSPTHGTIDGIFTEGALPRALAGRLDLEGVRGVVSTFGLVDVDREVPSFTFQKLASDSAPMDDRQALADVVVAQIPLAIDGDSFVIVLIAPNGDREYINLNPDEDNTVDIVIGNLAPFTSATSCDNFEPVFDQHFEDYYRLADQPPPPFREAEVPFRTRSRSVSKQNVEYPSPPVVAFVEADHCASARPGGERPSSSNRPICTQVIFKPSAEN